MVYFSVPHIIFKKFPNFTRHNFEILSASTGLTALVTRSTKFTPPHEEETKVSYAQADQNSVTRSPSFLDHTQARLIDIKQILYSVTERLGAGGFYAGPQEARSGSDKQVESNVRQMIEQELDYIYEVTKAIKDQVDRLV